MTDYEPLNLSAHYNADAKTFGWERLPALGRVTFHGLPFQIGPEQGETPCVIGFGQGVLTQPYTIPLDTAPRWLIVAHRLVDSKVMEGDSPGRVVAEYVFCYADGEEIAVPIRERFEIGVIPSPWGQLAFLAWPDRKEGMVSRHEGSFSLAGNRQTEVHAGWPCEYYLWPWRNPTPERALAALRIVPAGPRFYVGGITLGFLEEEPFCRTAKQTLRIDLLREEDARKPFSLDVDVDRGAASYPYPLPPSQPETFLNDDFAGWGEAQNAASSPAHVDIVAIPSATVTVKQEGEVVGAVRWGDVLAQGQVQAGPRLRVEMVNPERNWVRTTVVDEETGRPLPCRIHFRSREGTPYQPHGHHHYVNSNLGTWHIDIGGDVRLGQMTYAYINGQCEGWLPRGDVLVDIARGYEYVPIRTMVTVAPGQQELVFRLKRFGDMRRERFFSGDTHVHFLSTQGAHTEAAGEGLNVVNLLQSQWGNLFTNTEEFIGRPTVSDSGETIVYASQENRQHILGHLSLLGLKQPVYPWCSGGPDEAEFGGNLETTLCRWADACRAQGGVVVIPHLPNPNCEPAALIATDRVDAVEMLTQDDYCHLEYYRYLNCGYRLPLAGGTDKMTADVPVGIYRTYVHIPEDEPFTYETWLRHLKAGETFISGGPLLRFRVEGQPIGSTIQLPGNGGTVEVHAQADSILPIYTLEIVKNGEVVARSEQAEGARSLKLRVSLPIERHSWVAARCGGPGYSAVRHHDGWRRGVMAHTSPVYIAVGEPWWMFDVGTAQYLLTLLNGGLEYIRRRAPQWPAGRVTHHHGQSDHQLFLEEPFQQAIAALHRRMHALGIPH